MYIVSLLNMEICMCPFKRTPVINGLIFNIISSIKTMIHVMINNVCDVMR